MASQHASYTCAALLQRPFYLTGRASEQETHIFGDVVMLSLCTAGEPLASRWSRVHSSTVFNHLDDQNLCERLDTVSVCVPLSVCYVHNALYVNRTAPHLFRKCWLALTVGCGWSPWRFFNDPISQPTNPQPVFFINTGGLIPDFLAARRRRASENLL